MTSMTELTQAAPARLVGLNPAMPRVNLLPPEIAEARQFRKVQVGLGGLLVAAVALVGGLYYLASQDVADAQSKSDAATAQQTKLTREQASLAHVTAAYAQADAARAMLATAMGQEIQFSHYLNDLSMTVPDNVWLGNVNFTESGGAAATPGAPATGTGLGTVTFTGTAFSNDDVATWLETLAKQKGYSDPTFTNSTAALIGARPTVTFSSSVTLNAAALSNRFTKNGG